MELSNPSSLRRGLLIGVYIAPLITQLGALPKESRLLAHGGLQMTAPAHAFTEKQTERGT